MAYKLISHVVRDQRFLVYKIGDFYYHKRLFRILDPFKPYELFIEYKELSKTLDISPIMVGGHAGFHFQNTLDLQKVYKFRLSEKECFDHIQDIKNKKELIDNMLENFTNDMMIQYNRKMLKQIKDFNDQNKKGLNP